MDELSQKYFDEIVVKEPEALTEGDILFLKARSKYLSRELKQKYATQLGEEIEVEEKPEVKEEEKRAEWSEHPADKKVEEDDDDDE